MSYINLTQIAFIKLLGAAALLTSLAAPSLAADLPYNESADAKGEVRQAQADASEAHQPLLIVFGANWCEDCRALDEALKHGRSAELVGKQFKVVKVNVGNFNRNLDIVQRYGNPIQGGIPAAVIVSSSDQVLFTTRGGELADARRMSDEGLAQFFEKALKATTSH